MQKQQTISQWDCDMHPKVDFIMVTSHDQLSGWIEKKLQSPSQSQTCTKKKGHGHCLMVCCPPDPLQLSKSLWSHYIWEVSSANWWNAPKTTVPAASIVNRKGPILHNIAGLHIAQPILQMLNESVCKVLPYLPYSLDLWSAGFLNHFFKNLDNFLQGKHFHNQQEAENAFQEFGEFQSMDLMLQE